MCSTAALPIPSSEASFVFIDTFGVKITGEGDISTQAATISSDPFDATIDPECVRDHVLSHTVRR